MSKQELDNHTPCPHTQGVHAGGQIRQSDIGELLAGACGLQQCWRELLPVEKGEKAATRLFLLV
jgi:hypothetical protein